MFDCGEAESWSGSSSVWWILMVVGLGLSVSLGGRWLVVGSGGSRSRSGSLYGFGCWY